MKIAGALLCAGCITALLAVLAIGTASAAVVPFSGVEYSWLHHNDNGEPVADWIKRISDLTPVRNGDMMEFKNRWYNSYAGTADIRISYGGEHAGICAGADEYVFYGLNYGNYYPSSTESVPYYSKVIACNQTPLTLLVSHQYKFNGITYGTINPDNDYTMLFQWRAGPDSEATPIPTATATPTATPTATARPNATASPAATPIATATPTVTATATTPPIGTATVQPSATSTPIPLPSAPVSTPGFGFGQLVALAGLLAIAYAGYCIASKR